MFNKNTIGLHELVFYSINNHPGGISIPIEPAKITCDKPLTSICGFARLS